MTFDPVLKTCLRLKFNESNESIESNEQNESRESIESNEWRMTYGAAIGLLARVDAHVYEQLVARVEGPMASRAAGPEAGKVLGAALVDVTAFDVLHQLLLTVEDAFTVDPAAGEQIGRQRRFLDAADALHAVDAALVLIVQL